MFDFDSLLTGAEVEYNGKNYFYIRAINSDYIMAAPIDKTFPISVVVIPSPHKPDEEHSITDTVVRRKDNLSCQVDGCDGRIGLFTDQCNKCGEMYI